MENSRCTCTPGTESNGWHEYRCEACQLAERDEFMTALRRYRERYPTVDEHWSLLQNGYTPGRQVIHNAVRSVGDVGAAG